MKSFHRPIPRAALIYQRCCPMGIYILPSDEQVFASFFCLDIDSCSLGKYSWEDTHTAWRLSTLPPQQFYCKVYGTSLQEGAVSSQHFIPLPPTTSISGSQPYLAFKVPLPWGYEAPGEGRYLCLLSKTEVQGNRDTQVQRLTSGCSAWASSVGFLALQIFMALVF